MEQVCSRDFKVLVFRCKCLKFSTACIQRLVSSLLKNFMKGFYKMERDSARNVHGIPTAALGHFVSLMLMGLNPSHLEVVRG
uniref:Uncharacterized protein n=1 Tax=Arundo donax TaxID=35708 RepID=A0A0A9CSW1_ARUDO